MIHQEAASVGGHGAQAGTVSASPAVKLSFNRASAVFSHPEAAWAVDGGTGGTGSTGNPAQGPGLFPGGFPQQPDALKGNLSAVVKYAYAGLGHSYVWGGTSFNNGWDCSGFVQWAYAQAGIALPRVSQWTVLTPTTTPSPGDLVAQRPDGQYHWAHVGIYVGDGMMISALNPDQGTVLHSVGPEGTSWFFTTKTSAGADSPASLPVAWQPPPLQSTPETGQTERRAEARDDADRRNGASPSNRSNAGAKYHDRSASGRNDSGDTRDQSTSRADRQDDRKQSSADERSRGSRDQDRNKQSSGSRDQDRNERSGSTGKDRDNQKGGTGQENTDRHSGDGKDEKDQDRGQAKDEDTSTGATDPKTGPTDPETGATNPTTDPADSSTDTGVPATGSTPAGDSGGGTATANPDSADQAGTSSEMPDSEQGGASTMPTGNEETGAAEPEGSTETPPATPALVDPSAVLNAAVAQTGLPMDPATFIETVLQQAGYPPAAGPRDYLQLGTEVPADEAQPGDLLYYPATAGKPASVAVHLGGDTALRVDPATGVVTKYTVSAQAVTPVYIHLTAQP